MINDSFNEDNTCPECAIGRMYVLIDDIYECSKCGYREKEGDEIIELED